MNRFATWFYAAAPASASFVVAFLFSSCASARLEYVESDFSETGVTGRKITAAAVVDAAGAGVSPSEAGTIADQLTGQLRKKRRKAEVVALRNPGLRQQQIGVAQLKNLAPKGVRFAMVIELTGNRISERISFSESENTEPIYDKEGKEIGCRVVSVDYTTSSITTRRMEACYKLVDLESGKTIWVASTSHSESNTESCTDKFDHPPAPSFPPPPVVVDVTENMSRAAIRKLPRQGTLSRD